MRGWESKGDCSIVDLMIEVGSKEFSLFCNTFSRPLSHYALWRHQAKKNYSDNFGQEQFSKDKNHY